MTDKSLSDLGLFFQQYGNLLKCAGGSSALPVIGSVSDYWLSFGPTWPHSLVLAPFVSLISFVLSASCYLFLKDRAQYRVRRILVLFVAAFLLGLVLYFILAGMLVVSLDEKHRYTMGAYTEESLRVKQEQPEMTDKRMIAESGGKSEMVYIPWTIKGNELLLVFLWVLIFVSFAGITATLVLLLRSKAEKNGKE